MPKVDAELHGYPELVAQLEDIRRRLKRPDLTTLVPEVRRAVALRFEELYPRLHRTGRLRASLTRPGSTGGYVNLSRDAVEVGTTLGYASLVRPSPLPDDRDIPAEAWALLVADHVVD